jgi:hypothetical protein
MKNFEELTIEELEKVFNNNEKLQTMVYDAAIEDINFWVGEYFNCFERGALDCNIGYPGNYITVKNNYDFIQGLKELQKQYEYLSRDAEKDIKYCDHLMARYNDLPLNDYKNADLLENRIDELINGLKSEFLSKMVAEYDYYYDLENLKSYFLECYSENMSDNYYINDNFILYEHIEYEKCYK